MRILAEGEVLLKSPHGHVHIKSPEFLLVLEEEGDNSVKLFLPAKGQIAYWWATEEYEESAMYNLQKETKPISDINEN